MKRRSFLTAASAALFTRAGISSGAEFPAHDAAPPSRVGATDVAALRDTASHLRTLAHTHGHYGGLLTPTVNRAEHLLDVPAAEEGVQLDLLSVTGELHRMAGWAAHDASATGPCRAHLRRSIELHSAADDAFGAVWACTLAGVEADERGGSNDALHLFQMAQGRLASAQLEDPRIPGITARLHADAARALVEVGEEAGARNALTAAWDTAGGDPEGLAYQSAMVERLHGDIDAAEEHAECAAGFDGKGPDRRSPLFSRIMLADLRVSAGDESGLTLAEQVIQEVGDSRSARARHKLQTLLETLNARGHRELGLWARQVVGG